MKKKNKLYGWYYGKYGTIKTVVNAPFTVSKCGKFINVKVKTK